MNHDKKEIDMNKQSEKQKKNKILPILCILFATSLTTAIVSLCVTAKTDKHKFTPPAFETNAVQGTPTVDDSMGYTELYRDGMAYQVSVCGIPLIDEKELTVYFTSDKTNKKYLKLRILDTSGNILGETGLIRPGEYVKSVTLTNPLTDGTNIKLKIMGYEPEDYTSAGSVSLNVKCQTQSIK